MQIPGCIWLTIKLNTMDFACVSFFAGNQEKSCTTFKELPSWGYNHITFFTSLLHTLINCKFLFYWFLIKHRFTCMFSWMVVNKQWEHQVYFQLGDHNRLKNVKKKTWNSQNLLDANKESNLVNNSWSYLIFSYLLN